MNRGKSPVVWKKNCWILNCHLYAVIDQRFETLVLDVIIKFKSSFANDFIIMLNCFKKDFREKTEKPIELKELNLF